MHRQHHQRLGAVGRGQDGVAIRLQCHGEHLAEIGVIVDDEHSASVIQGGHLALLAPEHPPIAIIPSTTQASAPVFAKYRPDLIGYHRRVTATLLALVALADPADVYRLELARDLHIVGVGAPAWTAFLFIDHDDRPDPCPCDPSSVPSFDQFALHQHSQAANDVSNA